MISELLFDFKDLAPLTSNSGSSMVRLPTAGFAFN